MRLDKLAQALSEEAFTEIELKLDKPKTLWLATKELEISGLNPVIISLQRGFR